MGYNGKPTTYGCIALTGGTAGAVDKLPYANLIDGDRADVVTSTNLRYMYRFSSSSTVTEASPRIITPDDFGSGNGRWLLCTPTLYCSAAEATMTGTDETTLYTYTMPANTLFANNMGYKVVVFGNCTPDTGTCTIKAYYDADSYSTIVSEAGGAIFFTSEVLVYRRSASAAMYSARTLMYEAGGPGNTIEMLGGGTEVAVDFTAANIIKITGQGSAAADAIAAQAFSVTLLDP